MAMCLWNGAGCMLMRNGVCLQHKILYCFVFVEH